MIDKDLFNGMLQSWDSVHTDANRMDSFIIADRLTKKEIRYDNSNEKSDVISSDKKKRNGG